MPQTAPARWVGGEVHRFQQGSRIMGSASKFVDSNTPIVAAPPVAMVIHNVIPTIVEITAVAPHMRGAIANTVAHRTIAMARPKCDTGHRPTVAAELGHDCKNKFDLKPYQYECIPGPKHSCCCSCCSCYSCCSCCSCCTCCYHTYYSYHSYHTYITGAFSEH